MLEELFWENSYSAFNFYDYLNLSASYGSKSLTSGKETALSGQYKLNNLGFSDAKNTLIAPTLTDQSLAGNYYSNNIQMEDYPSNPQNLMTDNLGYLHISNDLNDLEDTYSNFKGVSALLSRSSSNPLSVTSDSLALRSYLSVFNHSKRL